MLWGAWLYEVRIIHYIAVRPIAIFRGEREKPLSDSNHSNEESVSKLYAINPLPHPPPTHTHTLANKLIKTGQLVKETFRFNSVD